jgi:hypothetical protein
MLIIIELTKIIRDLFSAEEYWIKSNFLPTYIKTVEIHSRETPSIMLLKYISAAAPSGRISDGLLYRIVESKTKLRTASLNPRKSHRISIEIIHTNIIDPIRPKLEPILAAIPFVSLTRMLRVKKNQAEAAAVIIVIISSPRDELNPRIKGEAYKFGLKSHPPMRVAGIFNSRHTNRTNHKERISTVVVIHL